MSKQSPLWYPYAQMQGLEIQYAVKSAHGVRLCLQDGRELIDAISSWWCVIHGYDHPELNQALLQQAQSFAHVMLGGLTHEPAQKLAQKLVELTPQGLNHVFFADSGSVGMEVAMKMAVQYWKNTGVSGKHRFISLLRGYHGDTTGVMSLGDPEEGMHHLFKGFLQEQIFVAPPKTWDGVSDPVQGQAEDDLNRAIKELRMTLETHHQSVAALVCEPLLQGAGGMCFYPPEYLRQAKNLCETYNVLMIVDEVATGFGRTGTFSAMDRVGVCPDIAVYGKGLSAGYLGLSATLATDRVYNAFLGEGYEKAFMHGPTYMGNALACSVALKGIEIFERDSYVQKINRIEQVLRRELLGFTHPQVEDVRVLGACGVIQAKSPQVLKGLQDFAAKRSVWLRPFLNVVYTMPPYIISEPELVQVCQTMKSWFAEGLES